MTEKEYSQALIKDSKRLIEQSKALIQQSRQGLAREWKTAGQEINPEMAADRENSNPQALKPASEEGITPCDGSPLQEQVLAQQKQVEQQWERVALDQDRVVEQKRKMGLL